MTQSRSGLSVTAPMGSQLRVLPGRRIILGLGANDRSAMVFMRSYAQFAPTQ